MSDLLRGRIDLSSTDTLIDMLARLGVPLETPIEIGRFADVERVVAAA